jgi:hypothetical protein
VKLDLESLLGPLVALALLVLTGQQTLGALKNAGAWAGRRAETSVSEDPYARIDRVLGTPDSAVAGLRDPFSFGRPPAAAPAAPRPAPRPAPVPEAPKLPALTAIVLDADPRATVRYDGREYTVRVNSLFAEFRVISITRARVVLDRAGESIVLELSKGE